MAQGTTPIPIHQSNLAWKVSGAISERRGWMDFGVFAGKGAE
jgi:hypothetical protein